MSAPGLTGRSVLVTGGASGIGAAMTRAFAAAGAVAGILDLDAAAGEAIAAETGAAFEPCDLRDLDALKAGVARLAERCGPATVLVNNAARDDRHGWAEVTPDYWDERMATNLRHQFFAIQAVAPGMIAAGGGSIVNMGSGSWIQGTPGLPVYGTAKAAVHGLTRTMARELGPHRIRVNTVIPGWVMTERQKELWVTPEKIEGLRARQCLPDLLQPGDLADAVLFLASDAARMITAADLMVDAGAL
ncbi:SDR family NAD(P)-dependent oxidoreductase [Mangrovicoccus algicola]|uniref:SDR family NAD(P)-dependent oxidoreductase n=1 Tax=Mangrovicoccus algicola TaxID=2771008 RepID=UPI002EDB3DC4